MNVRVLLPVSASENITDDPSWRGLAEQSRLDIADALTRRYFSHNGAPYRLVPLQVRRCNCLSYTAIRR
jgi:hypothetical protein